MKNILITISVFYFLSFTVFGQQSKSDKYLLDCVAYFHKGEFKKVISLATKAIANDPNKEFAYYYRGVAKSALKEYDEAIADFIKVVEINPKYLDTYYELGRACYFQKNYNKAINCFSKAIEYDSTLAKAYLAKGLIRYEQNDILALSDLNQAIHFAPNSPDAYLYRASIYESLNNDEKALEDYSSIIKLVPYPCYHCHYNRGIINNELGKYDAAIDDFDRYIELDTLNKYSYNERGWAKFNIGAYQEAIKDFNMSIKVDSLNPDPFGRVSKVEANLFTQSIQEYRKNLELLSEYTKKFVHPYINRGAAYFALKEYDKAKSDIEFAYSYDRTNSLCLYYMGKLNMISKNYWQAENYISNAITNGLSNSQVYYDRAQCRYILRIAEAYYDYNKALTLGELSNEQKVYSHLNKGNIAYFTLKNYDSTVLADFEYAYLNGKDLIDSMLPLIRVIYTLQCTNRKFEDALNSLQAIQKLEKATKETIFLNTYDKSDILIQLKRYEEANNIVSRFINNLPNDSAGNHKKYYFQKLQILILIRKGNYSEGIKQAEYLLKKVSSNTKDIYLCNSILFVRSEAFYKLKKYKNIIEDMNSILKIDYANAAAYYNLGESHYLLGEKDLGCSYIQKAFDIGIDINRITDDYNIIDKCNIID